jgi:acyl-CoA thioesterase FadM
MNLWVRLIAVLLRAAFGPAIPAPLGVSSVRLRVWPNDIDPMLHMNNGRYVTIMDLGRLDLLIRQGLWRIILRERWTPIVGSANVLFRRELGIFQRYRLDTRITGWDGPLAVIEQKFLIEGGRRQGQIAAIGLVRAGLYDRAKRAFVPIPEIMAAAGVSAEMPPLAPEIKALLEVEEHLKRAATGP